MPGTLVKQLDFPGGGRFQVVIYDLLYEPVDCIVNAANGGLSHGGGIAAAISKAAGPALDKECDAIIREKGRVPIGGAVVTTAGNLPFKGVIHVVGPRLGSGDEEGKIVTTLDSAFSLANEKGWTSLSFPGISSGIFSVPLPVCARAYIRAVKEFFQRDHGREFRLKTIRLCLLKGALLEAVKKELG